MRSDRVRLPQYWLLTWNDVDPAGRPEFDPAGVADLVRALPPAAEVPSPDTDWRLIAFWFDRMTEALVARLGDWVVGWWFTVTMEEHQDRGVIPIWRVQRPPVTTPEETLARIADAVVAWHEFLVELATDARGRFGTWAPAATDDTDGPPAWRAIQGNGRVIQYDEFPERLLPNPAQLSWAEIDTPDRGFDPDTVRAVVSDLIAASGVPSPEADWHVQDLWLENLTAGLVDRYGRWAVGWRWSVGEGDYDGGPVDSWCCYYHSVGTPEATVTTISAAVVEWREWLDDLVERFDRFLPLADDDLNGWERAVAHLVTAVGDRTYYESGWYGCCVTVLDWFLQAAGIESTARRKELLEHATAGRFRSWAEPRRAVVESIAEDLARRVAVDHA